MNRILSFVLANVAILLGFALVPPQTSRAEEAASAPASQPSEPLGGPATYDYSITHVGPMHVARGHDIYVIVQGVSNSSVVETVHNAASALPGVTASWGGHDFFFYQLSQTHHPESLILKLSVAPQTPPGPASVTVTGNSNASHVIRTHVIDLVVEDTFVEPKPEFNCEPQPIDSAVLSAWESRMLSFGATYGSRKYIDKYPPGLEMGTWYYDGARVFYQIADYTGDSSWGNSAEYSKGVYRPYVVNNHGRLPGYRNFARGLAMDYRRQTDPTERSTDATAVADLFSNCGPFPPRMPDVALSRETAYALNTGVEALPLGLAIDQNKLQRYVDTALGHIDQWVVMKKVDTKDPFIQPFMMGLTCEALINWYNWTSEQHAVDPGYPVDTRVIPAVKAVADWLIGQTDGQYNAWNPTYGCFNYLILYQTPDVDVRNIANIKVSKHVNQLNNLIVPMFGWLYSKYGESDGAVYRHWGDLIFAQAVTCQFDTGKQFSQNYRWSDAYVQWRLNNRWKLDTTPPVQGQCQEKALTATGNYVTWTTDEATSSVVEYGPTAEYGSSLPNPLLMKNHRQEITGLTAGTTYHYGVKSTDASGNVTRSADRTFVAGAD